MKPIFKLNILIFTIFIIGMFGVVGFYRVEIDTDVINSLPKKDPVISDAKYIFMNHPIHDQLVIDVSLDHQEKNTDLLVECANLIEKRLKESGLFKQVGIQDFQAVIPDLITHILNHLPILFTEKELHEKILPLLEAEKIHQKIQDIYTNLLNIESIGQADMISKDPLELKNIVMAKLSNLAPSENIQFYKGKLISSDGKHLLIVANPKYSGTDTNFSRRLDQLMKDLDDEVNSHSHADPPKGGTTNFILTPVGTYRNALDNELIIRKDVTRSIIFATVGIALLLIFVFPRPVLGLLSLLPAVAGTVMSFFVCSLVYKSLSVMVIGFGGAIISISVDNAIAYLLFLDRPYETYGKEASEEICGIALLATLTTIGAFGILCFTGFPIFEQLGLFTSLGIGFSFLFVHTIFPLIFPKIPAANPNGFLRPLGFFLQDMLNKFASLGKKGAFAALIFASVMIFFAKPEFNVSLTSMNTVSKDTLAAENLIQNVWGSNIFNKKYLMTEGKTISGLQQKNDMLLEIAEQNDNLVSGFFPSMIFPGEERRKKNFKAWKEFWNEERITFLKNSMNQASYQIGFAPDAFIPFYNLISQEFIQDNPVIPEKFLHLMGISEKADNQWIQFYILTPEKLYNSEKFQQLLAQKPESGNIKLARIFDPDLFSRHLGELLFSTFMKMFFIIGAGVAIMVFLFFLSLKLTAIALLPVLFALISTLGTLKLLNHPIDIPGLMLSIIILGMGIDYSLYFVKFYERYHDEAHPYFGLIRMTVFMASASTIIGFGVLCFAQHSLLRIAGIISLAAVGYSLIGAFIILPPVLKYYFAETGQTDSKILKSHEELVIRRYAKMETYPRLFARFKIMCDCMFSELTYIFPKNPKGFNKVIDIGTGYGIPAAWILEKFPQTKLYGIEPDYGRVRVASLALGERAVITQGGAPDIPNPPDSADLAMMIDMLHYLNDDELRLTLQRIYQALFQQKGRLIIRAVIPPKERGSWLWYFENFKLKLFKTNAHYRSADEIKSMIENAGFTLNFTMPSGKNGESYWFIAGI